MILFQNALLILYQIKKANGYFFSVHPVTWIFSSGDLNFLLAFSQARLNMQRKNVQSIFSQQYTRYLCILIPTGCSAFKRLSNSMCISCSASQQDDFLISAHKPFHLNPKRREKDVSIKSPLQMLFSSHC